MSDGEVAKLINESLLISSVKPLSRYFYARFPERYKNEHSCYVQTQKYCQGAVDAGWIEKGHNGRIFYRKKGIKSKNDPHTHDTTEALVDTLIRFPDATISREHSVSEIGTRPDAICLISKNGKGRCFILEVCRQEPLKYLVGKANKWRSWHRSKDYLSELFGFQILSFDIVISGKQVSGFTSLDTLLNEWGHDESNHRAAINKPPSNLSIKGR